MVSNIVDAARHGDVNEVRRLVEQEKVDANATTHLATPLFWACCNRHFGVVQYLIGEAGADANVVNCNGWTALHAACAYQAGLTIVQYLVETGGAFAHGRSTRGDTPLQLACRRRCVDTVKYLVEQCQAEIDTKNEAGVTPLHNAFSYALRRLGVSRYLLQRVDTVDGTVLLRAWEFRYPWDVKEMVLEKYAAGRQQRETFKANPIHVIFKHFPLKSKEAYGECIEHFPRSALYLLDSHGRLPIHEALTSSDPNLKSLVIVSKLVKLEPRSLLLRDPTTGIFPHELIALILSGRRSGRERDWLCVFYESLRYHPANLKHS